MHFVVNKYLMNVDKKWKTYLQHKTQEVIYITAIPAFFTGTALYMYLKNRRKNKELASLRRYLILKYFLVIPNF